MRRLWSRSSKSSYLFDPDNTYQGGDCSALGEADSDIVAHMNADHGEAIRLYAEKLLGLTGLPKDEAWRMTGIDPEGCDLSAGTRTARLRFEAPVSTPEAARAELVRLAKQARGI